MAESFPSTFWHRSCVLCGACCAVPDIATLNKPLGVSCPHLDHGCRCAIYEKRPKVCRNYTPDWVCGEVAPLPTLEAHVWRFVMGVAEALRPGWRRRFFRRAAGWGTP
jgi:Fe-S-cluster containining protein